MKTPARSSALQLHSRAMLLRMLCVGCVLIFTPHFATAHNTEKSFYLVDSLQYDLLEAGDRILLDTTLKHYHAEKSDTAKLDLLNHIVNACMDQKVWPLYNDLLKTQSLQMLAQSGKPDAWYKKVATMHALSLNNEGFLAYYEGDFSKALEQLYFSLDLRERIGDKSGVSECYNNIGGIHYSQHNYDKALELFKESLALKLEIGEKTGIATAYNNIGAIYNDLNELDSAEQYYLKCMDIYVDTQDNLGLGLIYHNLGSIYAKKGMIEKAEWFFNRALDINKREGQLQLLANSNFLLGKMYFTQGNLKLAEKFSLISLNHAEELGYPDDIKDPAGLLQELYRKQGKYKDALAMYDLYIVMKDSSFNDEIRQQAADRDLQYKFEKKALADSIRHSNENSINNAKIAEQDAIIKREQIFRISLVIGFVLLGALTLMILIALRNKKRANDEIARQKLQVEQQRDIINEKHKLTIDQKKMLEEQNREIKDSITYAKRLQEAILPSMQNVKKALPESFILYKPKDIVAGDFYWLEELDETVYFAAADCTGHGVPGAFVSVVCSNAMNQAILELGKCHPAELLEKVTELVIRTFEKSNQIIKDGMDIALCALNRKSGELHYAGAYNPLWIVNQKTQLIKTANPFTTDTNRYTLHEIKATKRPVGKYTATLPFEGHTVQLQKGDAVYLLSDGYADQFGGENLPDGKGRGKKFKYKQLKTLLLTIHEYDMEEQRRQLNYVFEQWKGSFEQLDDVCVIGVRI